MYIYVCIIRNYVYIFPYICIQTNPPHYFFLILCHVKFGAGTADSGCNVQV